MTKYTAFRCPVDLLEKSKIVALRDRRSLSNFIVMLIEEAVKNEPDLPKKAAKRAKR